jgi:anti-sigma regulatory factor (Ser/Thr protein kinase)/predicted ArsR family transcriptional regulator
MDWYLDPDEGEGIGVLRKAIVGYLGRHARDGSDLDGAELAIAELLGNAVRHARGPMWVTVSWPGQRPLLEVRDLGPGFELNPSLPADPLRPGGRGLYLVHRVAHDLQVVERPGGGSLVSAVLPVERQPSASIDPPTRRLGALPSLDEASEEGGFGKESFLRALVVQLAVGLEETHGHDAAEAAVAQVGTDVGGQMERAFRRATGIVDRLTPEQMADCYVRLKHAIDGGFAVAEVSEERVVLVNNRCPFGEVVRRSPSLCRMTSSVFGGIAGRNHDGEVAVVLEERIAVGDPGCRIVVWLGTEGQPVPDWGHRYRSSPGGDGGPG